MKKSLSVAMVVAMVSSMFASLAFADEATTNAPLTAEQKYEALKKAGVLEGDENGASLDAHTNRAQIAKILAKAFKLTEDASAASGYSDITDPSVTWATGYIGAVTKAKLMEGPADGKFAPGSDITMQELATVLVRAFDLDEKASTDVGSAKVDGWAQGYVAAALKAGLVSNKADFTAAALRSDLVYSTYVASQGKDVVALTADKWEVADSKNVKVTFSDKTTQTFPLATALEAGKATTVTVVYKDKEFSGSVTLPVVTAKLSGAAALTNNKVKLTLAEAATAVDKSAISIKDVAGTALEVQDATLSADGKSVVVTTAAQTAFQAYTVTLNDTSKNFVGVPTDTTKPALTAAGVTGDYKGTLTVVFNEDVDAATATNVANYTFNNSLTAQSATLGSDNRTVTIETSAQTVGTLYELTVQNVSDLAGNVMDKKAGLYFGGVVDSSKPTATVTVNSDATVTVTYIEKVNKDLATNVANYTIDNGLTVTGATIDSTNTIVTLTTSAQTVGTLYKLNVKNVADVRGNVIDAKDYYFGGVVDNIKPTATVTVNADSTVKVAFDKVVNKDLATNVANYTIDNNLTVSAAALASDNKTVTLTTTAQTVGTLYKLTVKNVADKSGNVIDSKDYYFGGVVDANGPTIASATTDPAKTNQVVLTFNEKLNKDLAQDPSNYVIDGGLNYPSKAVYADVTVNGSVVGQVTLTTASQTAGTVYNVTVNNLKDLVGNTIAANSKKGFSGVSSATTVLNAQTIMAVDQSTLDIVFDSEPSTTSVNLAVYAGNSATGTPINGLTQVTAMKRDDNKKILRVYFSNAGAFTSGNVYTAVISGLSNLPTDVAKNTKSFAGTSTAASAASATAVVPIDKTSVKVMFNKIVKNVQSGNFVITDTSVSPNADVRVAGVQDGTAGVLDNVTSATLNLTDTLTAGHVYKMTFLAGITDPAGSAYKIANSDNSAYSVTFGGTDVANVKPKMVTAVATDKYNFDVIFNEAVLGSTDAANSWSLIDTSNNNATVTVTSATYTASSDKTKVTFALNKNDAALVGGHVYKLTYNSGNITDKEVATYDATSGANVVQFGGSEAANAQPVIVAVDADHAAGTVKLTFSENLYGTPAAGHFNVSVDGTALNITGATLSGKTVTLTTDTAFVAAKTGSVNVTTAGSAALLDINKQASKTDAVSFGTR